MPEIRNLTDKNGNIVYPRTSADAIDINGENLTTYTSEINSSRGEYNTLVERLNNVDEVQAQTNTHLSQLETKFNNLGYINIKNYGAKGDGITDDTNIFKNVLKLARTLNSIEIYIPEGTYILDGYADIYSNTKIIFAPNAIIKKSSNATTTYVFTCGRIESEGITGYGGGAKNVEIIGGKFIGNLDENIGISMTFNHMQNFKISNCTFEQCNSSGHVFDLAGCKDIIIENCIFKGWKPIESRRFTEAIQIDCSTSPSLSDKFSNYDNLPTCNVTVNNCKFLPIYNEDGTTKYPAPNAIGAHGFRSNPYKNIKFINNICEGNIHSIDIAEDSIEHSGGIVRFYAIDGLYISGNTFIGSGETKQRVIAIQGKITTENEQDIYVASKNIFIEDNIIKNYNLTEPNMNVSIIEVYGKEGYPYHTNINIKNNNIINTYKTDNGIINAGEDVIGLRQVSYAIISGNIIDKARRICYIKNCNNITIEKNHGNELYCIPLSINIASNILVNNNIITNSYRGFYITESNQIIVTNNIMTDPLDNELGEYTLSGNMCFKTCKNLTVSNNQIIQTQELTNPQITTIIHTYTDGKNQLFTNNIFTGYSNSTITASTTSSSFLDTISFDNITQTKYEL